MKYFPRLNTMFYLCIITLTVFAIHVNATEILYEYQWTRIITGDRATRLTREIGEHPVPTRVRENIIRNILNKMLLPEQTPRQINAWQSGLEINGWAQFENEPEYETYRVVQLIVVDGSAHQIHAKIYGEYGQTTEAVFNLKGKQLSQKKIDIPETLDRTVFNTIRSPALFVLNQEHFQKHFFEGMLNLNYPGLEAVKQAYENKKILLAAHELAEYFRRKAHPIWESVEPTRIESVDESAEKILRHEFQYGDSTIYFGDRIDFRNNPTNSNEWIWGLNRMNHWVTLLNGYLNTSNEAYAREYNSEVVDWTVRNPAPPFRLTRVPSWRNLEAGIRMSSVWPKTFFGFLESSSFQTQAIQLMLASMWSHAEHILSFPSGMRFVNNWVIIGSNGLANVGMNFPEFQKAEMWAETGLSRLSLQLEKQVYPDGAQHELATSYHIACMHSFNNAFEVARKTPTPVPLNFSKTLEKMFDYIMYVSTPAREIPPTNDAHRNNIVNWMNIGADLFKRENMRFIATDGKDGKQPEQTSIQFPWAGHSVMRSDWGAEAWYLFFDAGPAGISHQHEDKLHIGVSAFGRDFLTDGGKGLYIPDKWRDYFVSTRAHNTILIDGYGQKRIPKNETHRTDIPLKRRWLSNENFDFASGTFSDGYGANKIPVTHSRFVLFKKKEYWLVIDFLTGKGSHKFDALYHFTPCQVRLDTNQHSVQTLFADGKNIKIVSAATVPIKIEIVEGQENPEQGWVSLHSIGRVAAPTAIFSGEGKLPILIATIIQSFENNVNSDIKIEIITSPSCQASVIIRADWGDDQWVVNLENGNRILIDGLEQEACVNFSRNLKGVIQEKFVGKFED
ncbi:alginate lyase family protein [candidate division KSB1 bacterium]|nr:alginate lyase family protein [candidate division KSB1 bacterium]